jgi:Tol biopolymer transport system component
MKESGLWVRAVSMGSLACLASGQSTTRVSVDSMGAQGNAGGGLPSISPDGRYVTFTSDSVDLVPGDTNARTDIFVHDRQTGATTRVSVDSAGAEANDQSFGSTISADGRLVAFFSKASNLVPGDTNGKDDVFVHDRQTSATIRVSVDSSGAQGNNHCGIGTLSADGRIVAFESQATNLVPGDTTPAYDIFVHDLQTGVTTRASVSSAGVGGNSDHYYPSLSADGRLVAFESSSGNLVPGDTGFHSDVFVHDRSTATTERVSVDDAGVQGNGASIYAFLSLDGRFVAYVSNATNLVPGDTNGVFDAFLYDRVRGVVRRVSVDSAGAQGNGDCEFPTLSADGRFVAFDTLATNHVPGDTNGSYDVFVHDSLTGTTSRVSVDSSGAQADADSYISWISADGRFIAFGSHATNLVAGDTNATYDSFVRDRGEQPIVALCFGDGSGVPCPCGNSGIPGHGCQNSAGTGGSLLTYSGTPSLSADTLVLNASGEKPTALSIFLQGSTFIAPVVYGDGLRCIAGGLKRLYTKSAVGGAVTAPAGGDPSISVRSAAAGDPIPLGATRHYQTYYRDPVPGFCPAPPGNTWNIGNSLSTVWGL